MITGRTAVYALLGRPVRHSRSPEVHNALLAHHGLDAVYVCLELPEGPVELAPVLRCLAGANLTVPFKAAVLGDLDEISPLARALGAVNTVVHRDWRLIGDNTDAEGFVAGLEEAFGPLRPRQVAVLGAGGAGRAVAAGAALRGADEVRLINRSRERAERAAADLAPHFPETRFTAGSLTRDALSWGPDLVVNATTGPAAAAVGALTLDRLPDDAIWCDLNYWMADPPCLAACRSRGLRVQEGLPMLVHQAVLAFRRFTGVEADPAVAWRALGADPPR